MPQIETLCFTTVHVLDICVHVCKYVCVFVCIENLVRHLKTKIYFYANCLNIFNYQTNSAATLLLKRGIVIGTYINAGQDLSGMQQYVDLGEHQV